MQSRNRAHTSKPFKGLRVELKRPEPDYRTHQCSLGLEVYTCSTTTHVLARGPCSWSALVPVASKAKINLNPKGPAMVPSMEPAPTNQTMYEYTYMNICVCMYLCTYVGLQNWGFYFLDPPKALGMSYGYS